MLMFIRCNVYHIHHLSLACHLASNTEDRWGWWEWVATSGADKCQKLQFAEWPFEADSKSKSITMDPHVKMCFTRFFIERKWISFAHWLQPQVTSWKHMSYCKAIMVPQTLSIYHTCIMGVKVNFKKHFYMLPCMKKSKNEYFEQTNWLL